MVLLGDLDRHATALGSGQFAAAPQAGIRALEPLDRQHRAFLDDDGLPNLQPGNLLGQAIAEGGVFPLLFRQLGPKVEIRPRHRLAKPRNRLDQLHAALGQFVTDRAKNRVRVALLQPEKHRGSLQVGPKLEQVLGRDLPCHDAVPDATAAERLDQLGQLAHPQPLHLVSHRLDLRRGLIPERHRDDARHTLTVCFAGDQQRQLAAPRDDAQRLDVL